MDKPKLIIATDGTHTAAMLDGVVIGKGVQKLEFSTEDSNGNRRSTLRVLDLDVNTAELSTDTSWFMKWVNGKE